MFAVGRVLTTWYHPQRNADYLNTVKGETQTSLSQSPVSEVQRVLTSCWHELKVRTLTRSQKDLSYRKHNLATQVQEQLSMGLH